jgi:O-antigen ligase
VSANAGSDNFWHIYSYRTPPTVLAFPLRLVHAWISLPALLFILALTAMLFRPPDLESFPIDRLAFVVLCGCVSVNICFRRVRLRTFPATWPLLALTLLALWGVLTQPYEASAWSLLAAKWIVPLILFHVAGLVFRDASSLRKLEVFCLVVLAYLSLISVLFLVDARSLIFPRFILDPGIGIHADRARGPFLQAVANGVCLNLLGIVALDSFRRGRLRALPAGLLFVATPLALLATKTRAVWLSAAISVVALACFGSTVARRAALALGALAIIALGCVWLYQGELASLTERLEDRSPVDFRADMYRAGWQMFAEKPLVGWGNQAAIQPEIAKRISDFHPQYYVFHNTYLEIAVERGVLGMGLYMWLILSLFRLRGRTTTESLRPVQAHFLDSGFRTLWPLMLGVYFLNAGAVVMNYQFVNGFVFSVAGILAAQQQSARERIQ